MLAMAPPGAQAADLVVWWDEGYLAEEGEAVREIVAAFEQESGKQVPLVRASAAFSPRTSPPSRRSTRRSPGSSRS
jgi:hypothetical protein